MFPKTDITAHLNGDMIADGIVQSRERMEKLGREYADSAEALKNRIDELTRIAAKMPTGERRLIERRIDLLKTEMREARRTGLEAAAFYLPGHRFLPRQIHSIRSGSAIC